MNETCASSNPPKLQPLLLFLKGVGSVVSIWPPETALSRRQEYNNTSVFDRVARLCSRIQSRGLSYSYQETPQETFFNKMLSYSTYERKQAIEYFSSIGALGIAPLLVIMRDRDISVRDEAFECFASLAEEHLRAFLLLLDSNDCKVKSAAVAAMRSLSLGTSAKEPLIMMMSDTDHLIRSSALYAIAESSHIDDDLFARAMNLANDPSEYVRKRVADVIMGHGKIDIERSKEVLYTLLNDQSRFVLIAAIEVIRHLPKEETKSFLDILYRLLLSPLDGVKDAAESCIMSIRAA